MGKRAKLAGRVKITSKLPPRIRHTGPAEPLVDPVEVAQALGARLVSSGGRRGLEGTTRRQKIPLSENDWKRLCKLADRLVNEGRPTPAQVASVLLRVALDRLDK